MTLYVYRWRNGEKWRTLHGRTCRLLVRGAMNSRLVEFVDNGQREIVSGNALRRVK